jgi:hypothetical protein
MLIKVYNTKDEVEQTIDVADFKADVHFHRNTRQPFTKEDIAGFTPADTPTEKKKK